MDCGLRFWHIYYHVEVSSHYCENGYTIICNLNYHKLFQVPPLNYYTPVILEYEHKSETMQHNWPIKIFFNLHAQFYGPAHN